MELLCLSIIIMLISKLSLTLTFISLDTTMQERKQKVLLKVEKELKVATPCQILEILVVEPDMMVAHKLQVKLF